MLPVSILLIANSVIKSSRSIQSGTRLSQRKACRQPSRTLAAWSRQSLPRSSVQLKATLLEAHVKTQDHCDTDMFSNLALAAWLAAKRTRQAFSQTFSLALHSTTEFFVFQQSFQNNFRRCVATPRQSNKKV